MCSVYTAFVNYISLQGQVSYYSSLRLPPRLAIGLAHPPIRIHSPHVCSRSVFRPEYAIGVILLLDLEQAVLVWAVELVPPLFHIDVRLVAV